MDITELTPTVTLDSAGVIVIEFCNWFESDDLGYFYEYVDAE